MNDQQLMEALRSLGHRPAAPDREFSERLWRELPHARPTRQPSARLGLVLLAALLALLAVAGLLAAGASRLLDRSLLTEASAEPSLSSSPIAESAPPSTLAYVVELPEDLDPLSTISAVEAVALQARGMDLDLDGGALRIESITLLSPRVEFPDRGGVLTSSELPVWAVTVTNREERIVVLFLADGSLDVVGVERQPAEPGPDATIEVLPTWDPAMPLELVSDSGRRIRPTRVPISGPGLPPSAGATAAVGGFLWILMTPIYTDEPAHLVRVDTVTGAIATVALPDGIGFGSLVAGRDRLWESSNAQVHELDPVTGELRRSLAVPDDAGAIGEDGDGLWLRVIGGVILVDPQTGTELRRISVPETGDHPYTGLWEPPAFGSLWDVDRGTGILRRIDPVTGVTIATIDIGAEDAGSCSDPRPLVGVDGLPDVVVVGCGGRSFLVDPAGMRLLRSIREAGPVVAVAGELWAIRMPAAVGLGWRKPGSMARLDPESGRELEVLTFSRDRTAGWRPVVVGSSVWLTIGERAQQNQGYDHNLALIQIPITELAR